MCYVNDDRNQSQSPCTRKRSKPERPGRVPAVAGGPPSLPGEPERSRKRDSPLRLGVGPKVGVDAIQSNPLGSWHQCRRRYTRTSQPNRRRTDRWIRPPWVPSGRILYVLCISSDVSLSICLKGSAVSYSRRRWIAKTPGTPLEQSGRNRGSIPGNPPNKHKSTPMKGFPHSRRNVLTKDR